MFLTRSGSVIIGGGEGGGAHGGDGGGEEETREETEGSEHDCDCGDMIVMVSLTDC